MQTQIEYNAAAGSYKEKKADFIAYLNGEVVGKAALNLADFVNPQKYVMYYELGKPA